MLETQYCHKPSANCSTAFIFETMRHLQMYGCPLNQWQYSCNFNSLRLGKPCISQSSDWIIINWNSGSRLTQLWLIANWALTNLRQLDLKYFFFKKTEKCLLQNNDYLLRCQTIELALPWCHTLKRKYCQFDENAITGCTVCHNYNFPRSQWWTFRQNDNISISVYCADNIYSWRLLASWN